MRHVVTGWDHLVGPWIGERLGTSWFAGRGSTIGLVDDDRGIVGATLYESCNGASILMHCAGEGRAWLNRNFLWYAFYYPFVQLGVGKIICPVEDENKDCRQFIRHIGFTLEATLQACSPKGNLELYTLEQSACKFLTLGDKYRGETLTA